MKSPGMPFTNMMRALVAAGLLGSVVGSQVAFAAGAKSSVTGSADQATLAEVLMQLKQLAAENKTLREKVDRLEAAQVQQAAQVQHQATQVEAQAEQVKQQGQALEKVQDSVTTASGNEARLNWAQTTTVTAYGEIGYSHPTKSAKDTTVDVQRAVIGLQHRFDAKTKVVSEFEWEHAITSSSDKGEAEVEQLWLEREFQAGLRGRTGLFLMPVGLINENHEPTAYYGVFRPDVDRKIVPSTWREVGIGVSGDTSAGLNWDFALTTAPNLSKWDASTTEGRDRGPLQAIHGEGQFAAARDLGLVGALNWRGQPGLLVGGSVVYDDISQHQPDFLANGAKLLMLDVHGRYQRGDWDLAGEYVRATISHTEALNTSLATGSIADPTLVPHLFYGGYVQLAYKLWSHEDYVLSPFARYEVLNTAANFGSLPASLGGVKSPDERIWTLGTNLRIGEGVVLKADYRHYAHGNLPDAQNHFSLGNSFNLGAGFSF